MAMRRIYGLGVFKIPHKNLFGTFKGVWGYAPQKILKIEPLRFAKSTFPAYIVMAMK